MKNSIIHLIRYAKERGCTISVYDGEEWQVKRSTNEKEIMEAVNSVCESQFRIRDAKGAVVGWALVIPELEPEEMVADYSDDGKFMDEWNIDYNQSQAA